MCISLNIMNWHAEARALIEDMRKFVLKIEVSQEYKSKDTRIYFDIETLEGNKLIVSMDSDGFSICDRPRQGEKDKNLPDSMGDRAKQECSRIESLPSSETTSNSIESGLGEQVGKVYETINALLDDNSPKYREAFAQALIDKIGAI